MAWPCYSIILLLSIVSQQGYVQAYNEDFKEEILQDIKILLNQQLSEFDSKLGQMNSKMNLDFKILLSDQLNEIDSKLNPIHTKQNEMANTFGYMKKELAVVNGQLNSIESDIYAITGRSSESHADTKEVKTMQAQIYSEVRNMKQEIESQADKIIRGLHANKDEITSQADKIIRGANSNNNEIKLQEDKIIQTINANYDELSTQLDTIERFANKSLLKFNPIEIEVFVGQEAQLKCGIIGVYHSCHWENDGRIYQLADVTNGSTSGIKASSTSIRNQCGIIITSVSASHGGIWTCKVLTFGQTLTASKTLAIGVCDPPCNNGGTCSEPKTCTCAEYWTGPTCQKPVCDPPCNNGGTCSAPKTCMCAEYWTGPTCEIPICDPPCNNGGTCSAPSTCSCTDIWVGPTCQTPAICDPPCNNGGTCSPPSNCSCTDNWVGPTCQTPGCPGVFVKSKGSGQCFKLFKDKKRSWEAANTKCELEGLHLAEPSDAVAVELRKDLLDTYGDGSGAWVAARGDNSRFVWQRSEAELRSSSPLWEPSEPDYGYDTERCVHIEVDEVDWSRLPGRPYASNGCGSNYYALCEVIRE